MTEMYKSIGKPAAYARGGPLPTAGMILVLVIWFLAALTSGFVGAFQTTPTEPPLALLTAVAGPPLIFLLSYRGSERIRGSVLGLDLRLLTALQSWRILGAMFLVLYAYGLLPGTFAWPAGAGDALVGLAAPFVLLAMLSGKASWRRQVAYLNIAGLVDFAVAVGTGVLSSSGPLGLLAGEVTTDILTELPLSLIPTFAVPAWIVLHLISLLQLHHSAHAQGYR
jgi:hypothetical protein